MKSSKKLNSLFSVFLIALTLTIFSSCNKDDEQVPAIGTFTYKVAFSGNSSSYLNFSTGELVLREIVWDGTLEGNAISTSITHSIITSVDVATGLASPTTPIVDIAPGKYSDISMGIELQDNGVDPNMILEGIFTHSNASTIPIKFIFDSGEVFEGSLSNYTIAPGSNTTCTLTLDLIHWFQNISQSELEDASLTSGTIVLSESSNAELYDKVETAILNATESGSISFK